MNKSKFIPPKALKAQRVVVQGPKAPEQVDSLLAKMIDGREYNSIVSLSRKDGEILEDIRAAIRDLEQVRGRPCVCYIANVVQPIVATSIEGADDLPFNEMLASVPATARAIDVFLVTPGGLGNQVSQFVNHLRQRFDSVEFILPHICMSAGTLWVLSGDKIWMDSRATIGPIDPQVRTKTGAFVPAQSVLTMLNLIRDEGQKALQNKQQPPWHYIRMIDSMDPKDVGYAVSASQYSIKMAADFLERYKFKNWVTHSSSGALVSPAERKARADSIAEKLCANDYWKSHAHGITRDVASTDLKLVIDKLESITGLERAVRRLWALYYYTLDKTLISKMFISSNYTLIRNGRRIDN